MGINSFSKKVKRLSNIKSKTEKVRGIITPEGKFLDDENIDKVITSTTRN